MKLNLILVFFGVLAQAFPAFASYPLTLSPGSQLRVTREFDVRGSSNVFENGRSSRLSMMDAYFDLPASRTYCELFVGPYISHGRRGQIIRFADRLEAGTTFQVVETHSIPLNRASQDNLRRAQVIYVLSADREIRDAGFIELKCMGAREQYSVPTVQQIQHTLGDLFEIFAH